MYVNPQSNPIVSDMLSSLSARWENHSPYLVSCGENIWTPYEPIANLLTHAVTHALFKPKITYWAGLWRLLCGEVLVNRQNWERIKWGGSQQTSGRQWEWAGNVLLLGWICTREMVITNSVPLYWNLSKSFPLSFVCRSTSFTVRPGLARLGIFWTARVRTCIQ